MPPDDQTVLHLHRRQHDDGTTDVEVKALGPLEIKDATLGLVEAVVATLNCVDRDRDVILSGAIPAGSRVKLSAYGHSVILNGEAPVGMGTITERGDKAIMEAGFFMNTQRGREAFETVKALGSSGEWSIGYKTVKESEPSQEWKSQGARRMLSGIKVVECSPVFEGASLATTTIGVKEAESGPSPEEVAAAEKKAAGEAAAIETKRLADETDQKARVTVAKAEHDRIQRYLRKVGVL